MKILVISLIGLFISIASYAGETADPLNCVNPGGGCDGTVPCCNSHENACVRGRCEPVPNFVLTMFRPMSCGTVTCYDNCTHGYRNYNGNTCDTEYSSSKHCYESFGYCKGSSGGNPCAGKTVTCYDICTHKYQTYRGNACTSAYDTSDHCYKSAGTCN